MFELTINVQTFPFHFFSILTVLLELRGMITNPFETQSELQQQVYKKNEDRDQ